jgi:hypothetical protein
MAVTIENNTKYDIYILSDGSAISAKKIGPKTEAIITEGWMGVPFKPGKYLFPDDAIYGPGIKVESFSSQWFKLADEALIIVNNKRSEGSPPLAPLEITEIIPVPPPPPPPEPTKYSISGFVVDNGDLSPLEGFKVEDEMGATGEEHKYDNESNFSISGTYTPSEGSYVGKPVKLTFSKEGYGTISNKIAIKKDQTINKSIFPIKLIKDKNEEKIGTNQARETSVEELDLIKGEIDIDPTQLLMQTAIGIINDRLVPYMIKKLLGEPFGIYNPIGMIKQAKKSAENAKKAIGEAKAAHEEKKEYKKEKSELEKDVEAQQEIKEKEWAGRENEIKALEKEKEDLPDDEDKEKEEKKIDKEIEKIRKSLKKDKDKFAKWLKDQND